MKKFPFILLIVPAFLIFHLVDKSSDNPVKTDAPAKGTAVLITGAAARIPQEAALLERLYQKGELNKVEFIAGASSGALNAVMLNGILSKKITWKQYERWLNEITNDSIYTNPDKRLPIDTHPLRNYLTRIVNDSLGYYKMKDLPIATAISITELNLINLPKKNFRLSNRKINQESDPDLDIVDVLMASTAFPVVFPEQKIPGAATLPDKSFADGGIGEDRVPYEGLIDFMKVNNQLVRKVFIISRKADMEPDINQELQEIGLRDRKIFDKVGFSLDEMLQKGFIKGLREYATRLPELADETYVYVPGFPEKFLLLNFNNLHEQYEVTRRWADKNNPVLIKTYLEKFN